MLCAVLPVAVKVTQASASPGQGQSVILRLLVGKLGGKIISR